LRISVNYGHKKFIATSRGRLLDNIDYFFFFYKIKLNKK